MRHPKAISNLAAKTMTAAALILPLATMTVRADEPHIRIKSILLRAAAERIEPADENQRAVYEEAEADSNRGLEWLHKGMPDRAIADFDQAIRLVPGLAPVYQNRGLAWEDKGDYKRAIADFDESIRLDPHDAVSYINRGQLRNKTGDADRAIADFDQAIRLDPKEARAWNNRGLARMNQGEYDRAITDLNEAIRLDRKLAFAYVNRGLAWKKKGEYGRAITDYDRAIRLDPNNAWAYHNRAYLQATCPEAKFRGGRKALKGATRSGELTSWKDPYTFSVIAAAHAELGDFATAVLWEEKAIGQYPKDDKILEESRAHLELYRAGKPYREPPVRRAAR